MWLAHQYSRTDGETRVTTNAKPSWADDVEDFGEPHSSAHFASSLYVTLDDLKPSDTIDENGIRTIVDYATNEAGKKIKVPFYFHSYSP